MNLLSEALLASDPGGLYYLYWAVAYSPLIPGFILSGIALIRLKADAVLWTGIAMLVLGVAVVVWNWDSIEGGRAYNLF